MLADIGSSGYGDATTEDVGDDDRRVHRRIPMVGTVLVIPREEPVDRFWATTANVSRGGMFVHTVMSLPLYAEVRARLHLKDGPVVRVQARVVRAEEGKGFGCSFTTLMPDSVRDFDLWLGPTGGLAPAAGTID